jgi:hypothetical protein
LVPRWVCVWDDVSKGVEWLSLLSCRLGRLRCNDTRVCLGLDKILGLLLVLLCSSRGGRRGRRFRVQRAYSQLLVLLQDAVVVVLPELFGGILACNALKD